MTTNMPNMNKETSFGNTMNKMNNMKKEPSRRSLLLNNKKESLRNFVSNIGNGISNKRDALRKSMSKQGSIRNMVENIQNNNKIRSDIQACHLHRNRRHPELGCLRFDYTGDSMEQAMTEAISTDRPIMIVFQELHGRTAASTCLEFGRDAVLSHPLVVEAAETLFVPVVINTNRAIISHGDASVLDFYKESRSNNPVVRFVSGRTGKDVAATRVADGNWTVAALAKSMLEALPQKTQQKNEYLDLLVKQEVAFDRKKEAFFSMPCFWAGEVQFANVDGVVGTTAGWVGNHEVVRVTYDPNVVSYTELVREAMERNTHINIYYKDDAEQKAAQDVITERGALDVLVKELNEVFSPDGDSKHALRSTSLRFVPLTALQSTKANRCIAQGRMVDVVELLSPRQLVLFRAYTVQWMKKDISMVEMTEVPITEGWKITN